MKNPIIIAVIVVVVAVLGIGAFTLSRKSSEPDLMIKKDEAMVPAEGAVKAPIDGMMKKEDPMMEKADDKMMSSRYVEYSKTAFDKVTSARRVLFFYASWCPTCRPADANFRANETKIPEDVTLIRVNYNDPETDQEEKDLAKKYGISYQHTYVQIDGTGKEITKWNGGQIDELLTNIK